MPQMVCKSAVEYPPGKYHQPGDRFEAFTDQDASALKVTGRAELADEANEIQPAPKRKRGRPPKAR